MGLFFRDQVRCGECDGTGREHMYGTSRCSRCDGYGEIGLIWKRECPSCDGSGEDTSQPPCRKCGGSGLVDAPPLKNGGRRSRM